MVALETARETAKRKGSDNGSFKAKRTAIVDFLRDKSNQESEYRKKELEHKAQELEAGKKVLEIRRMELDAQNQNLLNTLLELAKHR